jgi:hypothetical protein
MRGKEILWKHAIWAFLLMFTVGLTVIGRPSWAQDNRPPLKEMTPEEKKAYLEKHPEARESREQRQGQRHELVERLKHMTPEEREAFLKENPKLAEQFEKQRERRQEARENFKSMSPEEKKAFLKSHPKVKERFEQHRQERRAGRPQR